MIDVLVNQVARAATALADGVHDAVDDVLIRPVRSLANWVRNSVHDDLLVQHIIDGVVNAVGKGGRRTGDLVYKYIDQGLVDGAVNGSGTTARSVGGALQPVQSGKVNMYGALLFGAAAVGGLVLVLVNT